MIRLGWDVSCLTRRHRRFRLFGYASHIISIKALITPTSIPVAMKPCTCSHRQTGHTAQLSPRCLFFTTAQHGTGWAMNVPARQSIPHPATTRSAFPDARSQHHAHFSPSPHVPQATAPTTKRTGNLNEAVQSVSSHGSTLLKYLSSNPWVDLWRRNADAGYRQYRQ
jgi:hypothetical protein